MTILATASTSYKGFTSNSVRFMDSRSREVLLCRSVQNNTWTVYVNPTSRSVGKTFHSADEMIAHYTTLRGDLLTAMREVN